MFSQRKTKKNIDTTKTVAKVKIKYQKMFIQIEFCRRTIALFYCKETARNFFHCFPDFFNVFGAFLPNQLYPVISGAIYIF